MQIAPFSLFLWCKLLLIALLSPLCVNSYLCGMRENKKNYFISTRSCHHHTGVMSAYISQQLQIEGRVNWTAKKKTETYDPTELLKLGTLNTWMGGKNTEQHKG